jgi:5'-nucleotidase
VERKKKAIRLSVLHLVHGINELGLKRGKMNTKNFTILHSNDMHGDFLPELNNSNGEFVGGLSLLSGYLNMVRSQEKNVIFTISGDMLQGSIIDAEYKGISTIEIMNYLSPDVVCLGNHELDYGLPHLLFLEKMANFPIVNANMYIKKCHRRLMQSHLVIHKDGFDILFIGIITESVLQSIKQDNTIGTLISLEDAAEEVSRICDAYKNDDIDLTILLTHIGLDLDRQLAELLDPELGVDMILGGHSHSFLDKPLEVNGILIAQAGTGTDQIGRFDIVVDDDTNSIVNWNWNLVKISNSSVSQDDGLQSFIDEYDLIINDKYNSLVCKLSTCLTNKKREEETPLGNLFADILAINCQCDICLIGSGSIRVQELGPIVTLGDLVRAIPYEDKFFRFDIAGSSLKKIFSHILRPENRNHDGECYQINDGVQAIYSDVQRKLLSLKIQGTEIDDNATYSLGVQGFHYLNSDTNLNISQEELQKISGKKMMATSMRNVIEEYLRSHQNIYAQEEGRIVFI